MASIRVVELWGRRKWKLVSIVMVQEASRKVGKGHKRDK